LLGLTVPVPSALQDLFDRPTQVEPLAADYAALRAVLSAPAGGDASGAGA
jgi:hypothetical protein